MKSRKFRLVYALLFVLVAVLINIVLTKMLFKLNKQAKCSYLADRLISCLYIVYCNGSKPLNDKYPWKEDGRIDDFFFYPDQAGWDQKCPEGGEYFVETSSLKLGEDGDIHHIEFFCTKHGKCLPIRSKKAEKTNPILRKIRLVKTILVFINLFTGLIIVSHAIKHLSGWNREIKKNGEL